MTKAEFRDAFIERWDRFNGILLSAVLLAQDERTLNLPEDTVGTDSAWRKKVKEAQDVAVG